MAVLDKDLRYPSSHLRFDLVHELHRLDDADDLTFLDDVALAHVRLGGRRARAIERTDHRRLHRDHVAGTLDDDDGLGQRRRGRRGGGRWRRDALDSHAHVAQAYLGLGEAELIEHLAEPTDEIRHLGGIVSDPAADRRHQPAVATRPRYSPVRVSTFTTSPSLRKSGTWTTAPVSRVAGLVPPWAVSPRTPGSVRAMLSSTKFGSSTVTGEPSM